SFVTVGWGKKETQFHGSEGKTAALAKNQDTGQALSHDDKLTRITWRGDAQFFAISTFDEEVGTRNIRILTREGIHSTTCEPVNGLGQCLGWKPKGNLIVSAQYSDQTGHRIIFFERNGLRHGEFQLPKLLPLNTKVNEVKWNLDSSILAVHSEDQDSHISYLFLYTTCNYHWYMKKCLKFPPNNQLSSFFWDANDANSLHLVAGDSVYRFLNFSNTINRFEGTQVYDSNSIVAVCDACKLHDLITLKPSILITSFAMTVIPPPMSGCTVECPNFVNIISFGFTPDTIFATLHDNSVAFVTMKSSNNWNLCRILK
uniref:Elongator complex protein 1 n=1 Tax=Romanomermis culicivorax TaxID=13658 RepID=A0A915II08_ROMCU